MLMVHTVHVPMRKCGDEDLPRAVRATADARLAVYMV